MAGVQIQGVLDHQFFYQGPLGSMLSDDRIEFSLWAPTAQSVELCLWSGPEGSVDAVQSTMSQVESGVWSTMVRIFPPDCSKIHL